MVTATLTKLAVIIDNQPAPKPDGKNLWIDIDVNLSKLTALVHSQMREAVGTHKRRKVTFRADHDCVLVFSNKAVFDVESVQLIAYKEVTLQIKDATTKVETFYEIYIGATLMQGAEAMQKEMLSFSGPQIYVP